VVQTKKLSEEVSNVSKEEPSKVNVLNGRNPSLSSLLDLSLFRYVVPRRTSIFRKSSARNQRFIEEGILTLQGNA